ncbi:MAG: DUF2147 domain-containing protein [Bacteroidota bacterium]
MKQLFCLLCIMALTTLGVAAQSPIGVWKTIDDETGQAKSHVEIYEKNGKLYGKVVKLLLKPADTVCEACKGAKKNKPVLGMVIIEDLVAEDGYWQDGEILDPNNGSTYGCSVWFEDGQTNEMKLRGRHWTGLYRTQTWYRVK